VLLKFLDSILIREGEAERKGEKKRKRKGEKKRRRKKEKRKGIEKRRRGKERRLGGESGGEAERNREEVKKSKHYTKKNMSNFCEPCAHSSTPLSLSNTLNSDVLTRPVFRSVPLCVEAALL